MNQPVAYEDAVNLLDADHKAVKQMFTTYGALCEDGAPASHKLALAHKICQALNVHAQIEEEIFYPPVRIALHDETLMDEALAEHAQAKDLIAKIEAMKPTSPSYDPTIKELGKLIDGHVLKEREQIFLKASRAAMDLRGMTFPLMNRQKQLTKKVSDAVAKEAV